MSKPRYMATESNFSLTLGEKFQHKLGHTRAGRYAIKRTVGLKTDHYEQLDWFSGKMTGNLVKTLTVNGDPSAPWWPANRTKLSLSQFDEEEFEALREELEPRGPLEATYYLQETMRTKKTVVHVGIKATEGALFNPTAIGKLGSYNGVGGGPLRFGNGFWLPAERHLEGLKSLEVVGPPVDINGPLLPGVLAV